MEHTGVGHGDEAAPSHLLPGRPSHRRAIIASTRMSGTAPAGRQPVRSLESVPFPPIIHRLPTPIPMRGREGHIRRCYCILSHLTDARDRYG